MASNTPQPAPTPTAIGSGWGRPVETIVGKHLAIDTTSNTYFLSFAKDHFEGRARGIAGHIGSVCTGLWE
jgi:hypothetical protein